MSFDLLPDHIIFDILELLWPNYTIYYDPLPHIARSSKRLNHLATPLLYREIRLVRWTQEVSLLKSLLKNPEPGTFCKSIRFERSYQQEDEEFSLGTEENQMVFALCTQRINQFCTSQDQVDHWLSGLKADERSWKIPWESLAALVISCTPNVKSIYMDHIPDSKLFPDYPLRTILNQAIMVQLRENDDSPYALKKLTSVEGSFCDGTHLEGFLPFLRLKSVRTAKFGSTVDDVPIASDCPDIEMDSLVLGTVIDGDYSELNNFLSHFKSLRFFRLCEDDGHRDPYWESEPHTLDDALSGLKHCLEELEIDQYERPPHDIPVRDELAPVLKHILLKGQTLGGRRPGQRPGRLDAGSFDSSLQELRSLCKAAGIVLEFYEEPKPMSVNNRAIIWELVP